jgi:hypothetical protein
MTMPAIRITLDSPAAHYQAGERLSGRYVIEGSRSWSARAVELSVLWYTAGQGDEDMAVHHFERVVDDSSRPLDLRVPRRFATELPASPLSYDGHIVKVCWCVRVRLFLPHAQETVGELPFRLGNVPAARAVASGDLGSLGETRRE